jgi:hypothetical protein
VKLDTSRVIYSKRDRFYGIRVPDKLSVELAYETGLHLGDGHLRIGKRKDSSSVHWIVFSGNWKTEKGFYDSNLGPLIMILYNKKPQISYGGKNTVRLAFKSQAVATFKHNVMGLPNGPKKGVLRIPKIISQAPLKFRIACLAGILDTDFSLHIKRKHTPVFSAQFPEECRSFVLDLKRVLDSIDVKAGVYLTNCRDTRYTPVKCYKTYVINIWGSQKVKKLLDLCKFISPKYGQNVSMLNAADAI